MCRGAYLDMNFYSNYLYIISYSCNYCYLKLIFESSSLRNALKVGSKLNSHHFLVLLSSITKKEEIEASRPLICVLVINDNKKFVD